MITGNKGEWSEIYALFKLLGDKKLFLGDQDLKKVAGLVYPILSILRTESNGTYEYAIQDELILITDNKEELKISVSEFKEKAIFLLEAIKNSKSRTFFIPEIEEFMQKINCNSLKANSNVKTDITIVVHDPKTNQNPQLGFSIKSQLGSPATLLNAGKTTNFIYQVNDVELNEEEINAINVIASRSKIQDRIIEIIERGGKLDFVRTEKKIFAHNLILIDSILPNILSYIIYEFYTSKESKLIDLVKKVSNYNPMAYDKSDGHHFYQYKMKRFLTDVALGMMPSKVWTGRYETTGGYLVVKEDGEILCYHIYSKNEFEDYLMSNTKLETASSSRHDFGKLYRENGDLFFKLNLQIRFIK